MVVWDVNGSQNGVVLEVSWGDISGVIVVMAELWVGLVVDVVLNIWLLVVVLVDHDWDVMNIGMVSVIVVDVVDIKVLVMMDIMVNIVVWGLVVSIVNVSGLVDIVVRGLVVFFVMNWDELVVGVRLMGILVVRSVMVDVFSLVVWCRVVLVHVPLGVVVSWVDGVVGELVVVRVLRPGVVVVVWVSVVGWLVVLVGDGVLVMASELVIGVVVDVVVVVSSPGEVVLPVGVSGVLVWVFPVGLFVVSIRMVEIRVSFDKWLISVDCLQDGVLVVVVWCHIGGRVVMVVELWVSLVGVVSIVVLIDDVVGWVVGVWVPVLVVDGRVVLGGVWVKE